MPRTCRRNALVLVACRRVTRRSSSGNTIAQTRSWVHSSPSVHRWSSTVTSERARQAFDGSANRPGYSRARPDLSSAVSRHIREIEFSVRGSSWLVRFTSNYKSQVPNLESPSRLTRRVPALARKVAVGRESGRLWRYRLWGFGGVPLALPCGVGATPGWTPGAAHFDTSSGKCATFCTEAPVAVFCTSIRCVRMR